MSTQSKDNIINNVAPSTKMPNIIEEHMSSIVSCVHERELLFDHLNIDYPFNLTEHLLSRLTISSRCRRTVCSYQPGL